MNDELNPRDCLPTIDEQDRQWLSYNPNTEDLVDWVRAYALTAIDEWNRRAQPEAQAAQPEPAPKCPHGVPSGPCEQCVAGVERAGAAPSVVEPVAWMHPDGRVIPAATKASAMRDGGAMKSSTDGYCTPLHPPRAPLTDDRLHKFLNAAAGEGFVLDGVDAADLYIALFPEWDDSIEAAHGIGTGRAG